MVQTGAALALIGVTLIALLALYYATIKYVGEVLLGDDEDEEAHEGNTNSGGRPV